MKVDGDSVLPLPPALVFGNATVEVATVIVMDGVIIYHCEFAFIIGFGLRFGRVGRGAVIDDRSIWSSLPVDASGWVERGKGGRCRWGPCLLHPPGSLPLGMAVVMTG